MKTLFAIILVFWIFMGCSISDDNIKYYFYETERGCNDFIFELNGIKQSIYNWNGLPVEFTSVGNGYFEWSQNSQRKYKEAYLPPRKRSFDKVEMANSQVRLRYDVMEGWLYNLRVDGKKWVAGLYMIEGTHEFEISEEEHRIFSSVIHLISNDLEDYYFPVNPTQTRIGFPSNSLYLSIDQNNTETEYFTAILSPICELNLLNQLVIMIIENNISPENKINPEIELLDIRHRHDAYVVIDSLTGHKVIDYRLIDPPPKPDENP